MSVKLGDVLSYETYQPLKKGVLFRGFDSLCTNRLNKVNPPNLPLLWKLPKSSRRDAYIEFHRQRKIDIKDEVAFCGLKKPFKAQVKLVGKCPFYGHHGIRTQIFVRYSEAASYFIGAERTDNFDWTESFSMTITSDTIPGDDFSAFGSSKFGVAELTVNIIDNEPENSCAIPDMEVICSLVSLGLDYEVAFGDPVQSYEGCQPPAGAIYNFDWTGINYSLGPIGLVMILEVKFIITEDFID